MQRPKGGASGSDDGWSCQEHEQGGDRAGNLMVSCSTMGDGPVASKLLVRFTAASTSASRNKKSMGSLQFGDRNELKMVEQSKSEDGH